MKESDTVRSHHWSTNLRTAYEMHDAVADDDVLAGQRPPVRGSPGSFAENSTAPPMKQNLFQLCSMPDCMYFLSAKKVFFFSSNALYELTFCSVVMLRTPLVVRTLSWL